jgi:uncharacterized membrane protein YgcG
VVNAIIVVRVLAAKAMDHTVFVVQATDALIIAFLPFTMRLMYIVLYELDPDKYLSNAQQLSAIVFNVYSVGVTLFWACIWRVLHPPGVEVVRYQDLPSFNDALDGTLGVGAQVDSRTSTAITASVVCALSATTLYVTLFRPLFKRAAMYGVIQIVVQTIFCAGITESFATPDWFTAVGALFFLTTTTLFTLVATFQSEDVTRDIFVHGRALQKAMMRGGGGGQEGEQYEQEEQEELFRRGDGGGGGADGSDGSDGSGGAKQEREEQESDCPPGSVLGGQVAGGGQRGGSNTPALLPPDAAPAVPATSGPQTTRMQGTADDARAMIESETSRAPRRRTRQRHVPRASGGGERAGGALAPTVEGATSVLLGDIFGGGDASGGGREEPRPPVYSPEFTSATHPEMSARTRRKKTVRPKKTAPMALPMMTTSVAVTAQRAVAPPLALPGSSSAPTPLCCQAPGNCGCPADALAVADRLTGMGTRMV